MADTVEPDWSQKDVKLYPNSPWLTTPPTEKALREFRPEIVFRPSRVRDPDTFATEVDKRVLFGHPKNVKPIRPHPHEYMFTPEEISTAPPPLNDILKPPSPGPNDPPPPNNFMYPKAGIWTLKKTNAYQRGLVYTTPYYLSSKPQDHHRMLRVFTPPQLTPTVVDGKYVHHPVPDCVQMVPGIPFAFEIDGRPDELHTIAAVHTFESLRHEPEFDEILENTILVAKGLRGCRPVGNIDEVFPITDFNIKTNDRSPTNVPAGSKAGSYNLASTLLKGNGPGIVLPAAQVDTPEFTAQVSTVLRCLGVLRRILLRKTLSKYEYDTTEFNSEDMNVFGFGGLEPNNATSCQLNLGPIWQLLATALGLQGSLHPDVKDEETRKTYFLMLLSLPPGSDAGAFLLARAGIYIRELNAWAIHIFFDGTDIHTGIGATTTLSVSEFKNWVDTELEGAWKASELGRMGIVQYAMRSAHNRDTYTSMMPPVRFGNIAPEPATTVRDYATHGEGTLGGREAWANRMAREITFNFWNQLQLCNLDLGTDIADLHRSITFKDYDGNSVAVQGLPFHSIEDAEHIALKRGHFEYFRQRCAKLRIHIAKHHFLQYRERLHQQDYDPTEDNNALYVEWQARTSISARSVTGVQMSPPEAEFCGTVVKILEPVRLDGQVCYQVMTDEPDSTPYFLAPSDPRLPEDMLNRFLVAELQKVSAAPILDLQKRSLDSTSAVENQSQNSQAASTILAISPPGVQTDPSAHFPAPEPATLGSSPNSANSAGGVQINPSPLLAPEPAALASIPNSANSIHPSPHLLTPEPALLDSIPNSADSGGNSVRSESPSETGSQNCEVSPEIEYDVEKIVEVRQDKQGKWYLCKFVGYDAAEWILENDLSTECEGLLAQFYETLADSSEEEPEEGDHSDSDEPASPRKSKRRKVSGAKGKQSGKPAAPIAKVEKQQLGKTVHLETLLNLDRLTVEITEVQSQRPTKGSATRLFFRALSSQASILNIVDVCYVQQRTLSALDMVIEHHRSSAVEIAAAQFQKLTLSAQAMPELGAAERVTNLLNRILRWTSARAHIVIYRWCSYIGSATVKGLFELHRRQGFTTLSSNPAMAQLVDHIVQYVCSAKTRLEEADLRRRGRGASSSSHGAFGPAPADLARLPGDLYGLLNAGDKKRVLPISLPDPGGMVFNIYPACEWCLMEVFQRAFILPAIRQCTQLYNIPNKRTRMVTDDYIFSRAICRGAVLDCILNAFGDDGILSSNAIDDVVHSPWLSFMVQRTDRVGAALLNRANILLAPLQLWLREHLKDASDILIAAKTLGNEIHTVLAEMTAGEPHPDTVMSLESVPKKMSTRRSATNPRKARKVIHMQPTLDMILPGNKVPLLGLPALIIREALNLFRGLPPGDSRLRRLLQGVRASISSTLPPVARNPDHLDPRREFNQYTALFRAHCPPQKLTGPTGLSNALAWFGTGQGVPTQHFLNSLLPDGGFFKVTLEAMVQQFENAMSQNAMTANPMKYYDEHAWSQQPNNYLSAHPVKKKAGKKKRTVAVGTKRKRANQTASASQLYTLLEKFGPKFEESVQEKWTKHLGPAANRDPESLKPEERPAWAPTLQLIIDLDIAPFGSGLTGMQLVNTLAFCKVVKLPTVEEMAEWLTKNKDLGAVAGLRLLGFRADTAEQIRGSYICFHNYLGAQLTTQDQADLGFHPPCTEHILCKAPRWESLLASDHTETLVQMAARLGDVPWIAGANHANAAAMPFPLVPARDALEVALKLSTQNNEMDVDELESEDELIADNLAQEGARQVVSEPEVAKEQPEFVQGSSRMGRVIEQHFSGS